jgi:hypothetical protein
VTYQVPLGFIELELLRAAARQQEHLNYRISRHQFAEKSQGDPKTVARSGAVLRHYNLKRRWRWPSVGDQKRGIRLIRTPASAT